MKYKLFVYEAVVNVVYSGTVLREWKLLTESTSKEQLEDLVKKLKFSTDTYIIHYS